MRILLCFSILLMVSCSGSPDSSSTTTATSPPIDQSRTDTGRTTSPPPSGAESKEREPSTPPKEDAGNVTIDTPRDGATVTRNPIEVSGTARTFENNVVLEVHAGGRRVLQTATTARGDLGQFNPWSEELWLAEWPGDAITIRALEHSARDGSVRSQATVRLDNRIERREVTLFFPNTSKAPNDCSRVFPVTRMVPSSIAMAELLVRALMAGPDAEQRRSGFSAPFPDGTRLESVALRGGVLTVDFSSEMQNVGGSCRAQAIRASVEETLGRLPSVERVRITAGGSEELALQP